MSEEELDKIHDQVKQHVYIDCDEYHAHTTNCLGGKKDAVIICKLVSEIKRLRQAIKEVTNSIKE